MTDLEEFVHWTKIETVILAGNSRMYVPFVWNSIVPRF